MSAIVTRKEKVKVLLLETEVLAGVGFLGCWLAINYLSDSIVCFGIFFPLIIPIGTTLREKMGSRYAEVITKISPFFMMVWRIFWWGIVITISILLIQQGFFHSR